MASCTCNLCGQTWPYADPAMVVPCPKCGAKIGVKCNNKRPSGHDAKFGLVVHLERELHALETGALTKCPMGESALQEAVTTPADQLGFVLEES